MSAQITLPYEPRVVAPGQLVTRLHLRLRRERILLSAVADEVKGSLASARGFLEKLTRGSNAQDPQDPAELQRVHQDIRRSERLLMDTADYGRLRRGGTLPLTLGHVDLRRLVDELLSELSCLLKYRQIHVEIPFDIPDIYVDANKLMQVLNNLFINAHIYTPASAQIGVKAIAYTPKPRKGVWVKLTVWDTGPGIPPTEWVRVFKPLQRLQRDKEKSGQGIGLFLCRQICRTHGGDMWMEWMDSGSGAVISSLWPTLKAAIAMQKKNPMNRKAVVDVPALPVLPALPALPAPPALPVSPNRDNWQEWGKFLRAVREHAGMTRAHLATLSGVADSTIRNIETGRHRPTHAIVGRLRSVAALAALFGPSQPLVDTAAP